MNERYENELRGILHKCEEIHDLLTHLLDEKASNEAKKKGIVRFKSGECVSFMMNHKAHIGCLAKDLLSTDKIVEFHLYTNAESNKIVFWTHDTPFLQVKLDDITNIRNSQDSEIALLALICAENELFFDKKTHRVFPYKIGRAKKGGTYYSIFIYIDSVDITPCTDTYSDIDDVRFLEGRYFLSKDDAVNFISDCFKDKLKERSIL